MVTEDEAMCALLNIYFGSVFTSEISINVKSMFNEDKSHMLSNIEITQENILNKLSKWKINKVPGVDGILPRLLVENADVLCLPLMYIFKKSFVCLFVCLIHFTSVSAR